MTSRTRPGTALLIALLVLIAVECVVLGTVHLAMLERRLADNAAAVLRLRLDAHSTARAAASVWTAPLEALRTGERLTLPDRHTPAGNTGSAVILRLSDAALLVTAEARQPSPLHGRSAVALLLRPPALPAGVDFAGAALTAAGSVHLGQRGSLTGRPDSCAQAGDALRLIDPAQLAPGSTVDGTITLLPDSLHLASHLSRIAALARPPDDAGFRRHDEAATLEVDFSGVLLALGDLHVQSGVVVHGLLLVGGTLRLAAGATVAGAVHVAGGVELDGAVTFDPCGATAAAEAALLHIPRPAGVRSWLPGF